MNEAKEKANSLKSSFEKLCGNKTLSPALCLSHSVLRSFSSFIKYLPQLYLFSLGNNINADSAKEEITALDKAEKELMDLEKDLRSAEAVHPLTENSSSIAFDLNYPCPVC